MFKRNSAEKKADFLINLEPVMFMSCLASLELSTLWFVSALLTGWTPRNSFLSAPESWHLEES